MRGQTSKEKSAMNVERAMGGLWQQRKWSSGSKGSDDVSEDHPDQLGKALVTLTKASLIGEEGPEHPSHRLSVVTTFCGGQKFNSTPMMHQHLTLSMPVEDIGGLASKMIHRFWAEKRRLSFFIPGKFW
jgi:hypothetical protein